MHPAITGSTRTLTAGACSRSGSLTVRASASKSAYGSPSIQTLADADAAGRQDVRRDAQDVVLEAARQRLEVEVQRLLGDQQVGVDLRQVAQLDRVVAAHRVAALEALGAHQVRHAVRQHVEVDARRRRGRGRRRCRRPTTRAPGADIPSSPSTPCRIR